MWRESGLCFKLLRGEEGMSDPFCCRTHRQTFLTSAMYSTAIYPPIDHTEKTRADKIFEDDCNADAMSSPILSPLADFGRAAMTIDYCQA